MIKLSPTQIEVLKSFENGETHSAYTAQCSIATLNALVIKKALKNVTPPGPGGMFSPQTHFKYQKA